MQGSIGESQGAAVSYRGTVTGRIARGGSALAAVLSAALVWSALMAGPAHAEDSATPDPAASASTSAPAAEPEPTDTGTPTPSPTTTPTPTPTPTPTKPPPTKPPAKPPAKPPVSTVLKFPLDSGTRSTYVRLLQKRLMWLGYDIKPIEYQRKKFGHTTEKAVKAFQVKFFQVPTGVVRKGTWEDIKSMSGRIGKLPRACTERTSLCIDKTQKLLRYVRDGKVVITLDARFGMSSTPTREGVFSVFRKSRDHYSSLYGSWMPFAMFFSGGQAVHYSPYFARDGYYGASHGCINIRDYDGVRWVYDRVPLGTRVVVYRS